MRYIRRPILPPKFKFTRDQIIDTAFNLVRRNGWNSLTTRSIAQELGSSARPIYSYFDSMEKLEEEIVKRAVKLLYDDMVQRRTGDRWQDHGIGYVFFAMNEKHLFRSINDEKHIGYFKKYGDQIWAALTESLADYAPFLGLTAEQIHQIQLQRWLFVHGLAFSVSNPPPETWTQEKVLSVVQSGSRAIFTGLTQQYKHSNRFTSGGEK